MQSVYDHNHKRLKNMLSGCLYCTFGPTCVADLSSSSWCIYNNFFLHSSHRALTSLNHH